MARANKKLNTSPRRQRSLSDGVESSKLQKRKRNQREVRRKRRGRNEEKKEISLFTVSIQTDTFNM